MAKKRTVHLSIYMVKDGFVTPDAIMSEKIAAEPIKIENPGHEGLLYVKADPPVPPRWAPLFAKFVNIGALGKVSTISGALLMKAAGRHFVLAFGPSGRHLIKPDVCEERFGGGRRQAELANRVSSSETRRSLLGTMPAHFEVKRRKCHTADMVNAKRRDYDTQAWLARVIVCRRE